MLNEVKKKKRTLEQLKAQRNHWSWLSCCMGMNYGVEARTPLLLARNITAHLKFTKEQLDSPQHYWQSVLGTGQTKAELFGKNKQNL